MTYAVQIIDNEKEQVCDWICKRRGEIKGE